MENFKKYKKPRYYTPLDGISHTGARAPSGVGTQRGVIGFGSQEFKRQRPKRLETSGDIGSFSKREGYQSNQASLASPPVIGSAVSSTSTAELPGVEEIKPPKKPRKRLLSRIRRTDKKKRHSFKSLSWSRRILRIAKYACIAFVLTFGFLFAKAYIAQRKIFRGGSDGAVALNKNVDPTKLNGEGDGRVNILLLGKGGDGHEAPDLTDTIIIASIDPVGKEAALLSIPRDLYVKPSGGSYTKINAVYANAKQKVLNGQKIENQKNKAEDAGLSAIENTIKDTLGIPIHYHVMVDFKTFKDAVNAVDGVTINVTEPLYERMHVDGKPYILDVKIGQQRFDGMKALMYARSRHTSARGDFDRAERQRAILIALKDRVLSLGTFSNPLKISQLIDAFGDHLRTNFSIDELMRVYDIGKEIQSDKIKSIGLADPPNNYIRTDNINGLSVVVPRAGLGNYKEIQSYVRNTLKDGYIKSENAQIMILNGTQTAGLATKTSDELKSYGYNVGTIGDAPTKTYEKTILVDLRSGDKKYTKRYLEQRFGLTVVDKLPDSTITPGTADFVIILGKNESARLED